MSAQQMDAGPPRTAGLSTGLAAAVRTLLADGSRKLLGLTGPPGAGKSTLALAIEREFPGIAQVVPMDGFHLANRELERLGRAWAKGAPDTFDAGGYISLLRRLRMEERERIVYAPEFRREIEEAVAGAIAVLPETRLVVTEGNYLLMDGPWAGVARLLDEVWYVDLPDEVRRERLALRHQRFGRDRTQALAWIASTDDPNARMVAATRDRADRIVCLDPAGGAG